MKDQKEVGLDYLSKFIEHVIKKQYNNNYSEFAKANNNLKLFVNNYAKMFVKDFDEKFILSNITQKDYDTILLNVRKKHTESSAVEIKVHNIISNDISFVSIKDVNINALSPNNKKIYDEAIQIINHRYSDNNVFIGMKDDNLVRMLKDKKGIVKSWIRSQNGRIIQNDKNAKKKKLLLIEDNKKISFSNALILSFIIGSFIGILFLTLYVKFLK